jgi:hypothetical protein
MQHETMALLRENIAHGVMTSKRGRKINARENFEVDLCEWRIEHPLTAN